MSGNTKNQEMKPGKSVFRLFTGAQNKTSSTALIDLSGAAPGASAEAYAARIKPAWYKQVDSIIEICKICAEANARLKSSEKKHLYSLLPFGRPTFAKLAGVGADARLQSPDILPFLPSSISTMYELAKLDDNDLLAAKKATVVRPDLTRQELMRWINTRRNPGKGHTKKANPAPYAIVRLPEDLSEDDRSVINAELESLEELGADVTYREDQEDERNYKRWERRVDARMRSEVSKKLREMKRLQLKGKPRGISRKDWEQQKWPYEPEDIAIDRTAGQDRVRQVLTNVGRGDDFEESLAAAEQHVRQNHQ
jgi:hypothetical protein